MISTLLLGCAQTTEDQQTQEDEVSPQATEEEVTEELDNTFVEDEELDIGELY